MPFEPNLSDPIVAAAAELRGVFHKDAVARDKAGGRPVEQIRLLKASGLPSAIIPQRYGGPGASWLSVLRAVREFARTDGSLAHLYGYHFLPLHFLLSSGSEAQKERFLTRSAAENWVWGNSGNVMSKTSTARRDGEGYVLDGFRPFSSGSHVADYLQVAWEEGDARLYAVIPADRTGVVIEDDWDGVGQRQTGSGTVTFRGVRIEKDDIVEGAGYQSPFRSLTSLLQQAVLLNVFVGSAQGAILEGRDYTIEKSRPWVYSGYERHADDPFVQRRYGDLYIRTLAATELADKAGRALDEAYAKGPDLTAEERGALAVELAAANVYAGQTGLAASSGIFEATGARSATKANGFDRFWRNVRTHTLHNPAEYKKRTVGTWLLTGEYPAGGPYR